MRVILHIGTEKTATTTLQHFLHHNRAVLADKGYGLSEVTGARNNRKLAAFCQPDDQFDGFFLDRNIRTVAQKTEFFADFEDAFRDEVATLSETAHSLILTSEHLHSRLTRKGALIKLHELLAPLFSEIRVICYFREQAAVARSLYSTAIKAGRTAEFETFIRNCTPDNHRYNYHRSFSKWAEVFGRDALQARLFLKEAFFRGDICADFLQAVDSRLDPDDFEPVARDQNESLGAHGLELGRINNMINPRYLADGSPNALRRIVLEAILRTGLAHEGAIDFVSAKDIHALFDASNRAFAETFLGRADNPFPVPSGGAAAAAPIPPEALAAFWETFLSAIRDLPVLAPAQAGSLRGLARKLEQGKPPSAEDTAALKAIARQVRPGGTPPD